MNKMCLDVNFLNTRGGDLSSTHFLKKMAICVALLLTLPLASLSPTYSVDQIDIEESIILLNHLDESAAGYITYVKDGSTDEEEVNMKNIEDNLRLIGFSLRSLDNNTYIQSIAQQQIEDDADIEAAVIGDALFYPSPMQQSVGGRLGYELSKDMAIELQIYDMTANLVLKNTFDKGSVGGRKGYNKLLLNSDTFDGYELSAGVYFYYLIYEGTVLTRGKVGVIP